MKAEHYLRTIAIFFSLLVISLPISFANEINIQTDANGNVINDGTFIREYNGLNQLVRIKNATDNKLIQEFIHHPTEERIYIKKEYNSDGSLKEKKIYINKNSVRKINSSGTYDYTFVYHNGQLVSQEVNGEKLFVHGDVIGSTNAVTNSSGDLVETTTTSPFGEIVSGGTVTERNYEAKEYDSVVQDTDFHFRKYKAEWALFTQPDTLIPNVYDPQLLNRYSFERNNPYRYKDPSGHDVVGATGIALIAVDLAQINEYSILIEINEDPNLERELINARKEAQSAFLSGFITSHGVGRLLSPGHGLIASAAFTFIGSKTLNSYTRKVVLANPFKYKEYLDQRASQMQFYDESLRKSFYHPGGVDILSLTSSLSLFEEHGGSSSIERSMQNTALSGSSIAWYYNTKSETYTWRTPGADPPSGTGWISSGGSSGSGGSLGGSGSSGGTNIVEWASDLLKKWGGDY